jgi:hypothetical protein
MLSPTVWETGTTGFLPSDFVVSRNNHTDGYLQWLDRSDSVGKAQKGVQNDCKIHEQASVTSVVQIVFNIFVD